MPDRSVPGIPPLRTGPLVLIVDDAEPDRVAVTRMVQGLGYPARGFRHGRDALEFVEHYRQVARIVIADLGMPVMDGGELVERVLDADPTMRAALMVDRGDSTAAELLEGYRDLPILYKPVRFADLYGALTALVGPPPHGAEIQPASIASATPRARRRTRF